MRTVTLAASLAVALSATGLAALNTGRGAAQFHATPVRAHLTLGPVQVLARPEPDAQAPVTPLDQAARARYGQVDALAQVRAAPLPGADGALVTGVAIRWR